MVEEHSYNLVLNIPKIEDINNSLASINERISKLETKPEIDIAELVNNSSLIREFNNLKIAQNTESLMKYLLDKCWQNRKPLPPSIDFTHGQQLSGSAEKGTVIYHAQANPYGLTTYILPAIEKAAFGSTLMIDAEDWIYNAGNVPWYGEASDEQALAYLKRYADVIRKATPLAKSKHITLAIYEVPTLLWKNYIWVRNDPSDVNYKKWLANQERILRLSEESDLLPAIRDAGGFVYCVGYLPQEWINHRFVEGWMDKLIVNLSRELDQRNVPHRWLFRAHGGTENLYKIMISRAAGRCDWWEDQKRPNEFSVINNLLKTIK